MTRPHWTEAWIGCRPGDCADLVEAVAACEFGHAVHLPARLGTLILRERQLAGLAGRFARPLEPGESPREGDPALMRLAGRRSGVGHHIGVWCAPGDAPSVLHDPDGVGAVLHAIATLPSRGWELLAVYRWLVEADTGDHDD